ncbi:MAG TPA: hypothetical protein VLO07_01210 [Thermoanaerobaculia bacterium]|nr:hypothetical protein [Thermoanaerobaculia bacterium]
MRQEGEVSRDPHEAWLSRPAPALFFALGAAIVASAAMLAGVRACRDRALLATGQARWIWCSRDISRPSPVRFYATRGFLLREVPATAMARIFVDRRWRLFINGVPLAAGEQRPGDRLEVWDVTSSLTRGANRVAIEAESPSGVGGILFCLDLGGGRKPVVSDASWRVESSEEAIVAGGGTPALEWGSPPMYPWGYPRPPAAPGRR